MTKATPPTAATGTKHCRRCEATKPHTEFAANSANRDGLQRYCRACMSGMSSKATREALALERGGMVLLDRSALVPSTTNPRKHFDPEFIAELAESIRTQGIAQPLLARPLPGSRVGETYTDRRADAPRPTHEIVAGEQRWRASEQAGLRRVPVLVRELSDTQVLQLQLVENLKRRDLHPMEEAEGYEKLRETAGMSAEDIAARIGKGRTYVYKTLQLLNLLPDSRQAFYDGKLTRSTAELLAARPPRIQLQVLKDFTSGDFHGEPMSFRKAKAHVDDRYMLKLADAPFATDDAGLLPDAGSCATCHKRTGMNPDLFEGAHADTCTDPGCFALKKEAHYTRIREDADARGLEVITGPAAKEIMPEPGKLRGYTRVDEKASGDMKSLRDVLGDDLPKPTLLEDPRTHDMIEVLPTATVGKLLRERGEAAQGKAAAKKPAAKSESATKREALEQIERTWRVHAIERVTANACAVGSGDGISAPVLRVLAAQLLEGLPLAQLRHAAGVMKLGDVAPRDALIAHIEACAEDALEPTLFLLLMEHDLRALTDPHGIAPSTAPGIETLAADFLVDLPGLQATAKKVVRDTLSAQRVEEAAQAVKASSAAATKATRPSKPPRPPKVSKAEASAAIAAQLQQADQASPNSFAAGQRVRIKTDLRRGVDVMHTRGMEADLIKPVGDRAWDLQPVDLGFALTADYTELEAIEP